MLKRKLIKIILATKPFILSFICLQSSEIVKIRDYRLFSDNIKTVQKAITNNTDLDIKNIDGNTPLIEALLNYRLAVAKLLIKSGADINIQNEHGYTAFMVTASNNILNIAKLLIDSGADLDVQNKDGNTALMIAEAWQNEEIVKLIKDRMEHLEKAKKEIKNLRDPGILTLNVSSIINEYL